MRLSRPRVLLRALLLASGGAFLLWRAWLTLGAGAEPAEGGLFLRRVALVEGLMGVLALGTAAFALTALRRKPRRHTLHLGGLPPGDRGETRRSAPQ